MPAASILGGEFTAYRPDPATDIANGYTAVRIYWGSGEAGPWTLVSSLTLVAGTTAYTYNKTDALRGDWAYYALYGVVPGEGPISDPEPIGPASFTRKQLRQGVGNRLQLLTVVSVASAASATDFTTSQLIDPDASNYKFANFFARPVSGSYAGATRRVRAYSTTPANCGWAKASGKVIVGSTFGGTLVAATEVELWAPRADNDPSALIDAAMDRARRHLWHEETFFLTSESSVTDYWLADDIREERVTAVDYEADSYPEKPSWRPVAWWEIVMEGGQPKGTFLAAADGGGNRGFTAGTVVRIKYNTFPDRLQNDADTWSGVDFDWAVAEVAMEYLRTQRGPTGGRGDVTDANATFADIREEVADHRITWLPRQQPTERIAR